MQKKHFIVLLVLLVIFLSWYILEFHTWKSFESISDIGDLSRISKISIHGEDTKRISSENEVEIEQILNLFTERKYKHSVSGEYANKKGSKAFIMLYVFHVGDDDGVPGVYPMIFYPSGNRILFGEKRYDINPPLNDTEFEELYEIYKK